MFGSDREMRVLSPVGVQVLTLRGLFKSKTAARKLEKNPSSTKA
jgi:hypothetical protein